MSARRRTLPDEIVSTEQNIYRLVQACRSAGFETRIFSKSAIEGISFAYLNRAAAIELLEVCAILIEHLNALERELASVDQSRTH